MVDPVFRSRRLGHVNLFVDDLDRSTRFYNDVCGLALEFRELGLRASFMGTGHTPHDLGMIETTKGRDRYGKDGHLQLPKEAGATVRLNHIAWEIDNEVELVAGYKRARARGVKIGRLADHQVAHSIYVTDPDGNVVEFYVDTVRDWRKVLHGDLDLITSTWDPETAAPVADPLYDPDPAVRRVEQAAFHPRRLTHVVLATHDVARQEAFYTDVAGLETVRRVAGGDIVLMRGRHDAVPFHLGIVKVGAGTATGLHHFALELDEPASRESTFLKDPDGFLIELFTAEAGARGPDLVASGALRPA